MNKERLLKLADYLEVLDPLEFNFGVVWIQAECGAVGCAMGHAPNVFPGVIARGTAGAAGIFLIDGRRVDYIDAAKALFGIGTKEAVELFCPVGHVSRTAGVESLDRNSPPSAVAAHIRRFISKKKPTTERT